MTSVTFLPNLPLAPSYLSFPPPHPPSFINLLSYFHHLPHALASANFQTPLEANS